MVADAATPQRDLTQADGEAAVRVLRQFGRFVGAGYLFYLILMVPQIRDLSDRMAPWWTPTAVIVIFGPGLALGLLTFRRNTGWVRAAAAVTALAYLIGVASWPLAWQGPLLENGAGVWFSTFPAVASMAAALAWRRPSFAFAHMVIACSAVQVINHLARQPSASSPLLPDIAFAISFSVLFVAAAVMASRTGYVLDSTRSATYAAAADAAATQARTLERERFDALTHDGVMSTLLSASRQGNTPGLRQQCRSTLSQLDQLRSGPLPDQVFDTIAVLAHLRSSATDVDESTEVITQLPPQYDDLGFPAEVARALGAGLAEAVRNSVRHAGPDANRTVRISVQPNALDVVVVDTGTGFDTAAVAAHRLGIAVSIIGRMRQLPGGSATIESAPATGTRVLLSWSAPE